MGGEGKGNSQRKGGSQDLPGDQVSIHKEVRTPTGQDTEGPGVRWIRVLSARSGIFFLLMAGRFEVAASWQRRRLGALVGTIINIKILTVN